MLPYAEAAYAATRLPGTMVLHNGVPVEVISVERRRSGNIVTCMDLLDGMAKEVKLEELDINPVQLGYVNGALGAAYFVRAPMRRDWKQGLRNQNIRVIGGELRNFSRSSIVQAILGRYPSLDEAISYARLSGRSMAFSRNFAVTDIQKHLSFKGRWIVGNIDNDKSFDLFPKFDWVRETLEEELAA